MSHLRPISLLSIISKVFKKLIIKRLKPIIVRNQLLPDHQFGFRDKHSTIDQAHCITNMIESALENKKACSVVLLDVSQASIRSGTRLVFKLEKMLLKLFNELLKSFLREFRTS